MRSKLLIVVLILSVLFISAFYLSGVMFDFVSQAYASCGGGGGNQNPVAILNPERSYAITGKLVILDGSSSYDPDGSITKYQWDFENDGIYDYYETSGYYPDGKFDGITRTKFDSVATHTVKLRVVDNQSGSDTDTADVNVSDDADANGLPDAWETDYSVSSATSDDDEDDYINFTEYLHDTVPNNPNSKPVGYSSVVTIWVPEDMENYTDANYIQTAINNAIDGDIIEIAEGTYYGAIDINDVNCTLTSTKPQDWTVVNNTIIDANDSNAVVVVIEDSQDANCILDGLTVTGGDLGIYCDASSPIIRNCLIKNNENGVDNGGGIYNCNNSSPVIEKCFVIGNKAYNGGGIFNYESSPSVINCVFSENTASYIGYGGYGGGICNYESSPNVINCTFSGNIADSNGGGMCNYGALSAPNVTNCIFWSNGSGDQIYNEAGPDPNVTYCCIEGGYDSNNISGDPDFRDSNSPAGPDGVFGTVDDGLQLWLDSSCVDAADGNVAPQTDILGYGRVDVNSINNTGSGDPNYADMGAYELPRIWFVDKEVTGGSDDGSSWTNAYDDLQDALSAADSGDEIWVADGIYEPINGTDRTVSFELVEGVALYGGFSGTETSRSQRDRTLYQTVLSGDIQGSNNSYHVVIGADDAVLDGFKITDGVADGQGENVAGAGIYCSRVSPTTIRNCVIVGNTSTSHGAGMYNGSSDVVLTNCFFADNNSSDCGGAITNYCSSAKITNCVFAGNTAANYGGAICNTVSDYSDLVTLTNCTFAGNQAGYGGGMANTYWNSDPEIINCIFWGNTADTDDQVYNVSGAVPSFSFCDIEDCNGSGQNWDSNLGQDDGNNIDADPLFLDPNNKAGLDSTFGTVDDGLEIRKNSLCIDAANGDRAPLLDIIGLARVDVNTVDGNGIGNPDYSDIGSYEFNGAYEFARIYNPNTKLAYGKIQDAIDDSNTVDGHTLIMAKSTYYENNISYGGKAITIRSIDPNDSNTVAATIIDANDISEDVIVFNNGEDSNSVLEGITITGGDSGVLHYNNSSPTISKCRIVANDYCGIRTYTSDNSSPELVECTIVDNGHYGLAICNGGTVTDCKIINNSGGGIYGYNNITIKNCVIAENGYKGIKIPYGNDPVAVSNCTIVNNSSYGIDLGDSVDESITNCILWGNGDDLNYCVASYSCIENLDFGIGNIHSDPNFIDDANGDYHLSVLSACIDAGDPCSDYSNEPDGGGGRINMGVYGNTDEAVVLSDNDGDGIPDEWELYYWPGDDPNQHDPNDNLDDDDFTNWIEYLFGYNPNQVTSVPMELIVKFTSTTQIDPTEGETVTFEYKLNMDSTVTLSIINTDDSNNKAFVSSEWKPAGLHQIIWDGRDSNGVLAERYYYDISIDANDGDGNSANWTSPDGGETDADGYHYDINSNDFNPYKNIPVIIKCHFYGYCKRKIDIVKDGTPRDPYPYNEEYYICNVTDSNQFMQPGWNTFYWYGRWGEDANDPNAGKVCQEDFDVYFYVPTDVNIGTLLVWYEGEILSNFRCNPYRVIPTYDEITTISYDLAADAKVTIDITDPDGQYFCTLLNNASQTAGHREIIWHGRDGDPNSADSLYISTEGVYEIEVSTNQSAHKVEGSVTVFR